MRDWTDVWSRELIETPSVDDFAVMYFKYEPPASPGASGKDDEGEWECPFPEETE